MTWAFRFEGDARRELLRLDFTAQKRIIRYIETRIIGGDPRRFGKPLRGDQHGLWRWRVEDYRLIGQIQDNTLLILILRVAHRSKAYRD